MPSLILKTVGSAMGRDYPTLAAFSAALPPDLTAVDQDWVALLDAAAYAPASFSAICDATRRITLQPAAGQGLAARAFPAQPLIIDPPQGPFKAPLIHATTGPAIAITGAQTRLVLQGLQLSSANGPALTASVAPVIRQCLLSGHSANDPVTPVGDGSENLIAVQNGLGPGVALWGSLTHGTIVRAANTPTLSAGIVAAHSAARLVASAVIGYARSVSGSFQTTSARNAGVGFANMLRDTDDPSKWQIFDATVISTTAPAPDGSATAVTLSDTNSAYGRGRFLAQTVAPGTYTFAVHVKDDTAATHSTNWRLTVGADTLAMSWSHATQQLTTSTPTTLGLTASGVDLIGGGWRRLWFSFPVAASTAPTMLYYIAGPFSAAATGTLTLWGPSLTAGASPPAQIWTPPSQWVPGSDRLFLAANTGLLSTNLTDLRPATALRHVTQADATTDLLGRLRPLPTMAGAMDPTGAVPTALPNALAQAQVLAGLSASWRFHATPTALMASTALTSPNLPQLVAAFADPLMATHSLPTVQTTLLSPSLRAPQHRIFVLPAR